MWFSCCVGTYLVVCCNCGCDWIDGVTFTMDNPRSGGGAREAPGVLCVAAVVSGAPAWGIACIRSPAAALSMLLGAGGPFPGSEAKAFNAFCEGLVGALLNRLLAPPAASEASLTDPGDPAGPLRV